MIFPLLPIAFHPAARTSPALESASFCGIASKSTTSPGFADHAAKCLCIALTFDPSAMNDVLTVFTSTCKGNPLGASSM